MLDHQKGSNENGESQSTSVTDLLLTDDFCPNASVAAGSDFI